MFANSIKDFVSGLNNLQNESQFEAALGRQLSGMGYSQFSYVGVNIDSVKGHRLVEVEPEIVHLSNRRDWSGRYIAQNYSKCDPVVRQCFVSRSTLRWTESFMAHARSDDEATMMQDAWENGLRRGYTIPIHGPGGELGILMLSCTENDKEFQKLTDEHEYDLQVMSYHFHDQLKRFARRKPAVPPPDLLTEREVEILRWTIDGKTAWEIGQILKISERTVNFHLHNVMSKFGVHNKTHAAAKAVSFGLITNV